MDELTDQIRTLTIKRDELSREKNGAEMLVRTCEGEYNEMRTRFEKQLLDIRRAEEKLTQLHEGLSL